MNIKNIVVKNTVVIKDQSFANTPVLTLIKIEEGAKTRMINLSHTALKMLSNNGQHPNVMGVDYIVNEETQEQDFVLFGTSDEKITIGGKKNGGEGRMRVIKSYKINNGTRSVLSKSLYDTIKTKFSVDTTEDVHFLLTEVKNKDGVGQGVFRLSPYIAADFDNHENVEVTSIEFEGN